MTDAPSSPVGEPADAVPPASTNGEAPAAALPPEPAPSAVRVWGFRATMFGPLVLGPLWTTFFPHGAFPHWFGTFAGVLMAALAVTAAITDTTTRKIPNWLSFPMALWALLINFYASLAGMAFPADPGSAVLLHQAWPNALGAVGTQECLVGMSILFFLSFMIWAGLGGMWLGAGDVKYAAAAGGLLGVRAAGMSLLLALAMQGVFSLVWVVAAEGPVKTWQWFKGTFAKMLLPGVVGPPPELATLKRRLPLSAFFLAGLVVYFLFYVPAPAAPTGGAATAQSATSASATSASATSAPATSAAATTTAAPAATAAR